MRKSIICSIVFFALAVVFLALISVWRPFCLFASFCFLSGVSIPTYIVLVNYTRYKNSLKEQRFVDAYLYAEEQQNENKIKDFRYDKKTERKLKYTKYNNFTSVFALCIVWAMALVLFIVSIKIVFF